MIFIGTCTNSYSQISKQYFGQNAWMPDTIGDVNNCQEPPCILYGQLHKMWGDIKASGSGVIRFGGIAPDRNMPTNYQYLKMIDNVRANGMEPIIQVPFHMNRYSAAQAAEIVKFLNITSGRNIKYFIIGNEPDLEYKYTTASQIASYFKSFATAMKAVDPSIMTVGPECAWYNQTIINGLTTPGGADDITGKDINGHYYLDIISFHTYPFNGTQTRQDVVNKLTSSNGLDVNLIELNKRIVVCNTYHNRTGASTLKAAVTEANVSYANASTDNLNGVGTNSFVGGQFWAEMLAVGMKNNLAFINLWSVSEGSDVTSNIGFMDKNSNKKPSYYHFKMMSENFKGVYCNGTSNIPNVKSFGSKENQITVMVLNQDLSNYTYTVRLNKNTVSGSNGLKINIDANLDKEFSGSIDNQSTLVLVFDLSGNLVKKIEYKMNGMANLNIPPVTTLFASTVSTQPSPNLVTGVNSNELASLETRVYPNPSTGSFNVRMNVANGVNEVITMEVVNTVGQVVYHIKPVVQNGYINETIDLNSNLASGMYIIQTKIGDTSFNTKMLVTK
jgi:hypothetical protein